MPRVHAGLFIRLPFLIISVILMFAFSASAQPAKEKWSALGPEQADITCITVDPVNPSTIYVGTRAGLYRSTDAGETWASVSTSAPQASIVSITIVPSNNKVIYVASYFGISKTVDGGSTWLNLQPDATHLFLQPREVALDATNPDMIYVSQGSAIYRSRDGGMTWIATNSGDLDKSFMGVATDPHQHNVVYVCFEEAVYEPYYQVNSTILKSIDGGQTWDDFISVDDGQHIEFLSLAVGSSADGKNIAIYPGSLHSLSVCSVPSGLPNQNSCKLLDNRQGVSAFTQISRGLVLRGVGKSILFFSGSQPDTPASVPCPIDFFNGLDVDPTNPNIIYASGLVSNNDGSFHNVFLKSIDRGSNWVAIGKGLFASSISTIVPDSSTPGAFYVGASLSGLFTIPNSTSLVTKAAASGLEQVNILTIASDPNNPSVILAGGSGLFRSSDAGKNWTPISLPPVPPDGFPTSFVSTIAFSTGTPGVVYLAGGAGLNAIFQSTDSGLTWTPQGSRLFQVKCILVDPANANSLLVGGTNSGIAKSLDGGKTFSPVNFEQSNVAIYSLIRDPFNLNTLFTTTSHGLFKSTDGGSNWNIVLVPGTARFSPRSVQLDPNHSGTMYVGLAVMYVDNATARRFASSGVFRTINGGISWWPLGNELSNLDINVLAIDSTAGNLYAGTLEGGIYRTQVTSFRTGDLNHDGKIDVRDLMTLANGLAGNVQLDQAVADIYADGRIDTQDLIALCQYLAGNVKTLPIVPSQ